MIGLIIALGFLFYSIVVFGGGYFMGVGAVMKKLPPETRARIAAGQSWRDGRQGRA